MDFLNKFTKIAEKLVTSVEKTANNVSTTYKNKGFNGLIEKTNEGLDNFSKKTQNYYNKIEQKNKEILNNNKSMNLEDRIGAAAAVVVNTTQTIVEDAVKVTVDTVKNIASTEETIKHVPPNFKRYLTANELTDGELSSLDCTPLSIVLENIKAIEFSDGMPGKWKTNQGHIQVVDNKWFNFTTGEGNTGAVSLLTSLIILEKGFDQNNPDDVDSASNEALEKLQMFHADDQYQNRVSEWIKKDNEFHQRKSSVNKVNSEVMEPTTLIKKTRVSKKSIDALPIKKTRVSKKNITDVKKTRTPKI